MTNIPVCFFGFAKSVKSKSGLKIEVTAIFLWIFFYPPSGTILGLRRKTGAKGLHLACVLHWDGDAGDGGCGEKERERQLVDGRTRQLGGGRVRWCCPG